ncbi:hypothetical protein [Liberibacter crescens]|nr:hypothetical protein [Liberibacter crescens]
MEYVSTRGEAPSLDFSNVILKGLAEDGVFRCFKNGLSFQRKKLELFKA